MTSPTTVAGVKAFVLLFKRNRWFEEWRDASAVIHATRQQLAVVSSSRSVSLVGGNEAIYLQHTTDCTGILLGVSKEQQLVYPFTDFKVFCSYDKIVQLKFSCGF